MGSEFAGAAVAADGDGAGTLVTWQHQAANTHADNFRWTAHTHSITCLEAGLYELSIGLWPPTRGLRAEVLVDSRPAAIAAGTEASGLPQSASMESRTDL